MGSMLSPGVRWRELDFSAYSAALATSTLAALGGAIKGKVGVPTLVTSEGDLIRKFGKPFTSDYGLLSCIQYLKQGNRLYYVRVTDGTEETAEVIYNAISSPSEEVLKVSALTPGTWGNDIKVDLEVGSSSSPEQLYDLSINVLVDDQWVEVERFEDVHFDHDHSITELDKDSYIETAINIGRGQEGPSEYVLAEDMSSHSLTDPVPDTGQETLMGGADGLTALDAADYIGAISGTGQRTGLKSIENADELDINLVAVPGVTDATVVNAMLTLCSATRKDCFVIIDSPIGLTVDEVVDWHNGTGFPHSAFNNSYGGLWWPWVKTYDPYSGTSLWLPPSGFVAQRMAYADSVAYPWFAAAGYNRGKLEDPLDLEINPSKAERDVLYSGGNAINPIMIDAREGIVIWGDRTLQRKPTALDRIPTRRMLLYIEKLIATAVKYLVFEPNDPVTWDTFIALVTPTLEEVKRNRGMEDYKVICDVSINTPTVRSRNEMLGLIKITPLGQAEFITVDFSLFSAGASFSV